MDDETSAPVTANLRTGAVTADLRDDDDDPPIARPAGWVSSILWLILVLVMALIALGTAGAAVINFLSPTTPPTSSGEMVAMSGGAQAALVALFTNRPGSR